MRENLTYGSMGGNWKRSWVARVTGVERPWETAGMSADPTALSRPPRQFPTIPLSWATGSPIAVDIASC
jgi:hypothetical protein